MAKSPSKARFSTNLDGAEITGVVVPMVDEKDKIVTLVALADEARDLGIVVADGSVLDAYSPGGSGSTLPPELFFTEEELRSRKRFAVALAARVRVHGRRGDDIDASFDEGFPALKTENPDDSTSSCDCPEDVLIQNKETGYKLVTHLPPHKTGAIRLVDSDGKQVMAWPKRLVEGAPMTAVLSILASATLIIDGEDMRMKDPTLREIGETIK